jgi:thioredoxin 1
MKKRFFTLGFLVLAVFAGAFFSVLLKHWNLTSFIPSKDGIAWESSVNRAIQDSEKLHKILVMDFYADWCEYCREMEETTYRNPEVIRLSRDFVMAKVNVDKHQLLTEYFKVDGLPTLIFAIPKQGEITRVEGYESAAVLSHIMSEVEAKFGRR